MPFVPRCSLCFEKIEFPQSIFTSCGHFVCPKCFGTKMRNTGDVCPKCNMACSILYIDDNMPDEVQQFISSNPTELFSQALEICRLKFQENHNQCYLEYLSAEALKQKSEYEAKIARLSEENERLKSSRVSKTPELNTSNGQPFSSIKRPDFMSRFKTTVSATMIHPEVQSITTRMPNPGIETPQQTPRASPAPKTTYQGALIRPGTPSFMERKNDSKPLNPFTKQSDDRDGSTTPRTPGYSRRGLEIPGSISRHPQLGRTPARESRESTSLPFQLLRPPKSAPTFNNLCKS